jgi:hypothetical protein
MEPPKVFTVWIHRCATPVPDLLVKFLCFENARDFALDYYKSTFIEHSRVATSISPELTRILEIPRGEEFFFVGEIDGALELAIFEGDFDPYVWKQGVDWNSDGVLSVSAVTALKLGLYGI